MVGAAILSINGSIPEYLIDHALSFPLLYKFPLAPAEGLVLKGNGLMPVMNEQYYLSKDYIPFESSDFLTLLNEESYNESKSYEEKILKYIELNWTENNKHLINNFYDLSQKYENYYVKNKRENVIMWRQFDEVLKYYNIIFSRLNEDDQHNRTSNFNEKQKKIVYITTKNKRDSKDGRKIRDALIDIINDEYQNYLPPNFMDRFVSLLFYLLIIILFI